jgi:hypothetical protein
MAGPSTGSNTSQTSSTCTSGTWPPHCATEKHGAPRRLQPGRAQPLHDGHRQRPPLATNAVQTNLLHYKIGTDRTFETADMLVRAAGRGT